MARKKIPDMQMIDLVLDRETGEITGRTRPLTDRERIERFDMIRRQGLTLDLARRARDTAKLELKERQGIVDREEERLFALVRRDGAGDLFPVTPDEIEAAAAQVRKLIDGDEGNKVKVADGVSLQLQPETAGIGGPRGIA